MAAARLAGGGRARARARPPPALPLPLPLPPTSCAAKCSPGAGGRAAAGGGEEEAARGTTTSPAAGAATPGGGKPRGQFIFGDENLPTFFRRLAWSPDGAFLAVPAGLAVSPQSSGDFAAHVYARGSWAHPVLSLPTLAKPAVAVRFCPVIFEREGDSPTAEAGAAAAADAAAADAATTLGAETPRAGEGGASPASSPSPSPAAGRGEGGQGGPFSELPYRMVFAAASLDAVTVYDTCSSDPLAVITGLHYAAITDLAWAPDGSLLAISSSDGYCSFVSFEDGELGCPLPEAELPDFVRERRKLMRTGFVFPAGAEAKDDGKPSPAAAAASAPTPRQTVEARAGALPPHAGAPAPVAGSGGGGAAGGGGAPGAKRRITPVPVTAPASAGAGPEAGGQKRRRITLEPLPAANELPPTMRTGMPPPAEPQVPVPAAPRPVVPVPGVREAPAPAAAPRGGTPPPVANLMRSFDEVSASKPAAEPRRPPAPGTQAGPPPAEPSLDLLMARKPAADGGDAGASVPPGFL